MKRLLCGSVVLAASLALVSCSSDPTSDFRGTPTRILAEPTSLFIDQADDADVIVTLQDDQGNPLPGVFEVTAQGTGITVVKNEEFLGTTVGVPLQSQAQFIVTAGDTPLPSSFTLTSGELTVDIPVVVLPTEIATAAFSNPTPAVNEPVTITAEGYTFLPTADISFGPAQALVLAIAEDGSSMTFLPAPSTTGTALVDSISINFLPGAPLQLETTAELAVGAVVPLAGTDAPGTAPAITIPAFDESVTFYDGGTYDYLAPLDFGGTIFDIPARLYGVTIPADGDYTFTLTYPSTEDLGIYFFETDGTTQRSEIADADVVSPEEGTFTMAAGNYLMAIVNFSATNPPFFAIAVAAAATEE